MKKRILLFAAVAFATPAPAQGGGAVALFQDNLKVGLVRVPEPEYRDEVRWLHQTFKAVYTDDVRIRMMVTPSFSPMWAVAIKHSGKDYRVVYANPLIHLPNPGSVKPPVNEPFCEAPIDAPLAERLIGVWDRMLTNWFPRQPEPSDASEATLSFAARRGNAEMRVDVPAPHSNSLIVDFAALGKGLAAYCTSARYWAAAPVTWWNAKLLNEKLEKLETVLKPTTPAKLAETPYYGFWSFPKEDHLDPLMSPKLAAATGDKDAQTELIVFKDAFAPNVRARVRMDILPGISEIMAFVTEDKGRYRIVSESSGLPIFLINHRIQRRDRPPEPPIDPHSVPVVRLSQEISPALAKELIADWKDAMIWAVPGQRGFHGFDGTHFFFSMEDTSGSYAGSTRSSNDLPVLDALELVAMDMVIWCDYGAKTADKCQWMPAGNLADDVHALTRALKAKRQTGIVPPREPTP